MILTDWAKILCDLEDEERKDFMLMLADELSERGGELLRKLTNNQAHKVFRPIEYESRFWVMSEDYLERSGFYEDRGTTNWIFIYPSVVPNLVFNKLKKYKYRNSKKDGISYTTQKEAWEDLLDVLSKM